MHSALRRIQAICLKEFIQLRRDKLTFGMVVMIPLVQLLLFGYTINTDVRHVPIAVVDHAQNQYSRLLIEDIKASQVVNVTAFYSSPAQIMHQLRAGSIAAGLVIPRDIQTRIEHQSAQPVAHFIVDGSDTVMASALKSLSLMPITSSNGERSQSFSSGITVELLYNPEQRAALFTVPGLLGVILTMTLTVFTAIAIVRERERGNMELLIATPVKTLELMVGKLIPYVIIGLIQVGIVLLLGKLLFQLPFIGSLSLLFSCCLLFIFANLGLGLFISTRAVNQLAAMQLAIFVLLPSILLSGFMFPYQAMPVFAQWLAELLPMTHFIRLARGIILRGAEWPDLIAEMSFLAGFFMLTLGLALRGFKKRLD
ncbi:MAG: ABC transporter permease [Pseudomonadales bacterium]|nr:ABC transporter permease [Pseudomonadales bacterium]